MIVVSRLASGRQRAVESICTVDDLGIDVFYAGNAFSAPRSRRGVPDRCRGIRTQDACAELTRVLESTDPGPVVGSLTPTTPRQSNPADPVLDPSFRHTPW